MNDEITSLIAKSQKPTTKTEFSRAITRSASYNPKIPPRPKAIVRERQRGRPRKYVDDINSSWATEFKNERANLYLRTHEGEKEVSHIMKISTAKALPIKRILVV